MKYLDLITDALRLRNVVDEDSTPDPAPAQAALRKCNQMFATWRALGINLNYFSTDKLTDTLTIPDWAEQGATAQLAIRVAAGAAITPELQLMADQGMAAIRTKCLEMPEADMADMPSGTGQHRSGDFFNGG